MEFSSEALEPLKALLTAGILIVGFLSLLVFIVVFSFNILLNAKIEPLKENQVEMKAQMKENQIEIKAQIQALDSKFNKILYQQGNP